MIPRQAALPLLGLAGLLAYRCARRLRELRAECARLAGALASAEEERERHMKLRFEERTGRTSAEKRLREQTRATASAARDSGSDAYHYTAITNIAIAVATTAPSAARRPKASQGSPARGPAPR